MPIIQSTNRVPMGSNAEEMFRQPRAQIKASTGMNLPSIEKSTEPQQTQAGQENITVEDTSTKEVTLSPQLTALARKQQKLQAEIQAQREREAKWEASQADYLPKSKFKEKVQENAIEALQELGLNYEELTNLILSQQNGSDPNTQELKKLKDEIDGIKSANEQNVSKQYEATLNQYREQINSLVESSPDYDTIKSLGKQEEVLDYIVKTFEEEGKTLTVEKASKDIEDYLVDEALQMAKLKKVQSKLAPLQPEQKQQPKQNLKTLTQSVTATPTRSSNQSQFLSMKERIAQAVARAQK